jgi:hypothetical protein
MKKILPGLLFLFFFIAADAQSADKNKTTDSSGLAVFEADTDILNVGDIPYAGEGTYSFKFRNSGRSPLIIRNVVSQCSCLSVEYKKEPIKPGGSGSITLKYDTKKEGSFYKSMVIFSNAGNSVKKVYLRGRVKSPDK